MISTAVVSADRLGSTLNYEESIGSGVTFEAPEQPHIDRRRVLQEVNGSDANDNYQPGSLEIEPTDETSEDERPFVVMDFGYEGDDAVADLEEMYEDMEETDDDGFDTVGEPMIFSQPIARKLRKPSAPVNKAKKESFRDASIPVMEASSPDDHKRALQSCQGDEKYFKVDLTTDSYGFENHWTLKTADGALVKKGPADNSQYGDNTRYLGGFCLAPNTYKFTIFDQFSDGMCCGSGEGSYEITIDGAKKFSSPVGDEDWKMRVHTFTVSGDGSIYNVDNAKSSIEEDNVNNGNDDDGRGDVESLIQPRASWGGCQTVKIQFKIDKYGKETSVYLKSQSGGTVLSSVNEVGAYQTKTLSKCVSPGTYTFQIKDNDGLCCRNGQGYYKVSVGSTELFSGGYFVGSKSFTIKVGYSPSMSSRSKEWLSSHNSRRRTYHQNAGKRYRALRWSSTLASNAASYAKNALSQCSSYGVSHAPGVSDGENLAKNKGKGTWGSMYPADNIVKRWVDNEKSWSYPKNAHLTQVVWYSTSYVGCGESAKTMSDGSTCRVQVCRYTRPGNCGVKNGNWRAEAFKDETGCGDPCPKEGCYA